MDLRLRTTSGAVGFVVSGRNFIPTLETLNLTKVRLTLSECGVDTYKMVHKILYHSVAFRYRA